MAAAKILAQHRSEISGAVKFLFQPAEETASGAEAMIQDGALEAPKVDRVLAAHLWNFLPAGVVGLRPGAMWASVDELRIVIQGRGGHAGSPHNNIDPIPIASQVVLALQTLVSRETPPVQPALVSIGSMQGGTTWNVTPDNVVMQGTIRTFDQELRDYLVQRAEDLIRGICLATRADYEFEARPSAPPVVNDAEVTERIRTLASSLFGPDRVVTVERSMLGDDMSFFLNEAPGTYILVGSANASRGLDRPHHHHEFDFDEAALPVMTELLVAGTLDLLNEP